MVPVDGQADVLLLGIPYLGPYNVNSIMNPLLVYNMLLGYLFNLYRGKPLVREGGVLIGTHPMPEEFNEIHHPSYIDLWNEAFPETHDIREIHERYEKRYAYDPWYRTLYRNSYAYHGAHPFTVLYWAAHALDHLGDAILVGGDPRHHLPHGTRSRRLGGRSPPDGPGHRGPEPEHDLHAHPTPLHVRGELKRGAPFLVPGICLVAVSAIIWVAPLLAVGYRTAMRDH